MSTCNIIEMEDWEAWDAYPEHRWVFDKLQLSLRLGYLAGPTPKPVPRTGEYVVRPIYNLRGMAAGARIMTLEKDRVYDLPPSHFWCERFIGEHVSINYEWHNGHLVAVHTSVGETDFENLSRFRRWLQVENRDMALPSWISDFADVARMNIEFVDGCIIEIHLRPGTDFPAGATELIPVYSTTAQAEIDQLISQGYQFKTDYLDAEKNIADPRLGWMYK